MWDVGKALKHSTARPRQLKTKVSRTSGSPPKVAQTSKNNSNSNVHTHGYIYSPNFACEWGSYLVSNRTTFVDQDLLSWPTCLDLPGLA